MDLNLLFSVLEDIRDTSSRTEKEELLHEILASPNKEVFEDLVKFVFNPYRRLQVKVTSAMVDRSASFGTPKEDVEIWRDFLVLLNRLESGELVGKAARTEICSFLSSVDFGMVEWFAMFLNKNFKIGVGKSTIDKLFPGAIPRFGVQLCKKYKGGDLPYPHIIQPKMDGARGVVGRFDSESLVAMSRNGKPFYNVEEILEILLALEEIYGEPYVFDGEFYAEAWNDSVSILRSSKKAPTSLERLKYYIFDAIPLREWVSGKPTETPLFERDALLQVAVQSLGSDKLVHVPHRLAAASGEIVGITQDYVKEGWEGSVIKDPKSPYAYDRNEAWQKFKFVKDVDAKVVDAKLGWLHKYDGSVIDDDDPRASDLDENSWDPVVRSLIVDPGNGVRTSVGSGLKRPHKYGFLESLENGELVGQTVEVRFQEYTPDGKLLFPRFVRLREDKP